MISFIKDFLLFLKFRKYASIISHAERTYYLQIKKDINMNLDMTNFFDFKQNIKTNQIIKISVNEPE